MFDDLRNTIRLPLGGNFFLNYPTILCTSSRNHNCSPRPFILSTYLPTIPTDAFPAWTPNFFRVFTGINPFLSRLLRGVCFTTFRSKRRPSSHRCSIVRGTLPRRRRRISWLRHLLFGPRKIIQDGTAHANFPQPPRQSRRRTAVFRHRRSKRLRSHMYLLCFGLHTRLLSDVRISDDEWTD